MKKINIIIPVYADWKSLKVNIGSLAKFYGNKNWVRVFYINDCGPEAEFLEEKIKYRIRKISNFQYFLNQKNLGFVKNNNNAVEKIIDKTGDVLFLNSDTKVTKGCMEEMQRVLYSRKDIGIVNPRSNNATIWSVPMNGEFSEKFDKSYEYWRKLKKIIPEMYIAPTSHGFCMMVRREVIKQVGLFDEIYGKGYAEENDFTMRAREAGWLCATANRAFVFHFESRSFGNEQRQELIARNHKILLKRYPGYDKLIQEYLSNIIEPDINGRKRLGIAWRIFTKFYRGMEYGHKNGYIKAVSKIPGYIRRKLNTSSEVIMENEKKYEPKVKIWFHELSNTGAPIVMLDVLTQWQEEKKLDASKIEIYYGANRRVDEDFLVKISKFGVPIINNFPEQKRFGEGDVIVLNSIAYEAWFFDDLLTNIENGNIKHLFWYIHEDSEYAASSLWNFSAINPQSVEEEVVGDRYKNVENRFREAMKQGKITVYVPSFQTAGNWRKFFSTEKNIFVMSGRIGIRKEDFLIRKKDEFQKLDFVISGTVEPRKGQLDVIHALDVAFREKTNDYRDFSLTIVGVGDNPTDHYLNIVKLYDNSLGGRIKIIKRVSAEESLRLIKNSNFTITYSNNESFSMVTMEGMAFGHPIIRSDSSGQKEQLDPGVNGWPVKIKNWYGLVETIEDVLDRKKTTDEKLAKMSGESVKIAMKNRAQKYRIIDDIGKFL